jgi:polysaccharide export outer membrane protein
VALLALVWSGGPGFSEGPAWAVDNEPRAVAAVTPAEPSAKPKGEGPERSAYRIGLGDVLDVVVWKNPDVSRKVTVRVDGRITLPLVGELVVEGLTTQELTQMLADKLKDYFTEPVVTVSLEEVKYSPPTRALQSPSPEPAEAGKAPLAEPALGPGGRSAYRIGVGDLLDVVVWKNPDASRKVAVRMDGRITLPLVGELVVEGLTTEGLTSVITEKLKQYYTDPVVTVSLEEMRYSAPARRQPAAGETSAAVQGRAAAADPSAYRIGVEDILEVFVWKNPDVSRQVWVRPDGRVTLPLVGELVVEGLTTQQLTTLVTERLRQFFTDPVVTVNLMDINSYSIYLLGKIAKPGVMKLRGPKTFLQVVSMAGGFQEFADTGKVVIVRWERGKAQRISVDVDKILKKDVQGDLVLQPGDVVMVP